MEFSQKTHRRLVSSTNKPPQIRVPLQCQVQIRAASLQATPPTMSTPCVTDNEPPALRLPTSCHTWVRRFRQYTSRPAWRSETRPPHTSRQSPCTAALWPARPAGRWPVHSSSCHVGPRGHAVGEGGCRMALPEWDIYYIIVHLYIFFILYFIYFIFIYLYFIYFILFLLLNYYTFTYNTYVYKILEYINYYTLLYTIIYSIIPFNYINYSVPERR